MRQATHVTTITGQVIAFFFIFGDIWLFFTGDILDGIWKCSVAWA